MIDLIILIISEREQAGISPFVCPLIELVNRSGKTIPELRVLLKPLLADGIIHIGPTVNGHYIRII